MEINKVNGFNYDPYHSHSQSPNKMTSATTRQNVSFRRRCRSECLQMTPVIGVPIEIPNRTTYDTRSTFNNVLNKANMQKHGGQEKRTGGNEKRILSGGNNVNKDHIKENLVATSVPYTRQSKSPEIIDIRETCIRDLENFKDRLRSYSKQKLSDKQYEHYAVNGRIPSSDLYKRRVRTRTRSESEPHEIYNTKFTGANEASRDDVGHKRARDDSTTVSPNKAKNGLHIDTLLLNNDMLANHHHSEIISKNGSSLNMLAKSNIVSSVLMSQSKKRATTPTYKTNSPPRIIRKSPSRKDSPELSTNSLTSQENAKTSTAQAESEDECSSLEDDDDFGDLEGPAGEVDITDEEDEVERSKINLRSFSNDTVFVHSTDCVQGRHITSAPFASSLFPNCPPYISFASHLEKGPDLPSNVVKVLKWKLTTITPIVVRRILINSGFKLLKKTNDWVGTWGKHMKSPCFKTIRSYQKINHIPGTFQIGRKDRVWRNLQIQMTRHGKKEFNFMPRTFILPHDINLLRQTWQRYQQRNTKWIIKPPAAARGTGIKVVNRWSQIPKKKPLIVQKYVDRPLLINGSKFDLRLYVLVTSINPLRVYMHTDGLARFASVKYSEKVDSLNDRFMHLTNYSINKLSTNYAKNEDANACQGHKWTVKSLWTYLLAQGINTNRLWAALRNLVLRTIFAGEGPINTMTRGNMPSRYNCYELFGIDVILDSELIPWLLEVNISPSLHSASPLDMHVKGPLVRALLNTALYQVPPKLSTVEQADICKSHDLNGDSLCLDRRLFTTQLSDAEKIKHNFFTNKGITDREDYLDPILENLTPDDVRCLILTEDELSRCAPLERIFPAPNTHRYLGFTENPRYYNRLLDAWESRYGKRRDEGIKYLQQLCSTGMHMIVPPTTLRKDSSNEDGGYESKTTDSSETKATTDTAEQETSSLPVYSSISRGAVSVPAERVPKVVEKKVKSIKDTSDINGIKTIDMMDVVTTIKAQ